MLTGLKAFLEPLGMSGLRPCTRTHLKKGLVPHSSSQWDKRLIPTFSKQSNLTVWTDTCICCTNTYFVYMFCLFNTLVPPTFSSFCPLTGHDRYPYGILLLAQHSHYCNYLEIHQDGNAKKKVPMSCRLLISFSTYSL